MRIRKRTPARAASPGPAPGLSASASPPLPLPLLQQPKLQQDKSQEEDDDGAEEEKRVIVLMAGVRDDDRAPAAASDNSSATDDAPKPEPQGDAAARCSRNDGKRWRCKSAAAPGYLFCDSHIAWSTRKRKPRAKKLKTPNPKDGGAMK